MLVIYEEKRHDERITISISFARTPTHQSTGKLTVERNLLSVESMKTIWTAWSAIHALTICQGQRVNMEISESFANQQHVSCCFVIHPTVCDVLIFLPLITGPKKYFFTLALFWEVGTTVTHTPFISVMVDGTTAQFALVLHYVTGTGEGWIDSEGTLMKA